jgi:hypothetical protein
MSVQITRHATQSHADDDAAHPIPSVSVLDVVTILKGGGADLFIVVASPLAGDTRSLTRLRDKIEGYLRHIQSREFQVEAGAPTSSNTTIKVVLHPDSAPEAYELLSRSQSWVEANNASLKVEQLDVVVH